MVIGPYLTQGTRHPTIHHHYLIPFQNQYPHQLKAEYKARLISDMYVFELIEEHNMPTEYDLQARKFEETVRWLEETMNEDELVHLTVEQIRAYMDGEEIENMVNALDHAQGNVHEGQSKEKYILIKVTQ